MSHDTTNRPRMAATYAPGTIRARRWQGDSDVRGYRPPRGWTARADLTDLHPLIGPKPCRLRPEVENSGRGSGRIPYPGQEHLCLLLLGADPLNEFFCIGAD